jgi:hypothetical protein
MGRLGVRGWLAAAGTRRGIAAILVTVVTFAVIGVLLLATTPIGCGPAEAVGFKTVAACKGRSVASHAGIPMPSPLQTAGVEVSPSAPSAPETQPATYPPEQTPASALPPSTGPATGAYPPFYPSASGPSGNQVSALPLDCRLPVFAGPSGSGGFIVFPGGSFIADPKSGVVVPSPSPGGPSPYPQGPGGPGATYFGLSYDPQFGKWLPVSHVDVSPDGAHYAFPLITSIVVVDVASGTLSEVGPGASWNIITVQNTGVYAEQQNKPGLWLVPYSGAPSQVTDQGYWQVGNAGSAYGTPTSAVPNGATNSIIRVDVKTGQVSSWFTREGATSNAIGVDQNGAAIISVAYQGQGYVLEVWIASAAGSAFPIFGNSNAGWGIGVNGAPIADRYGIWFAASLSMYGQYQAGGFALYVPGSGTYWMSGLQGQLAGECIQP